MSLLEALVAPAILATALLSLTQVIAMATAATAAAGRATHAALLASQKIEELRAAGAPLEGGRDAPESTVVREWLVAPLSVDPDRLSLIHVVVHVGGIDTRIVATAPRKGS